jgi:hypothetical protein
MVEAVEAVALLMELTWVEAVASRPGIQTIYSSSSFSHVHPQP